MTVGLFVVHFCLQTVFLNEKISDLVLDYSQAQFDSLSTSENG